MDTERNLLFGVLALQADLLDHKQFAEACAAWAARKDTPLDALLVERGWLTADERQEVERLLQRKLKKHGGDARASLGASSGASPGGLDVLRSLGVLPPTPVDVDVGETLYSSGILNTACSRYRLTRLHGEGGLGRVWVACDQTLNREVALKELKPGQAADPEACRRFLQEAQVTGQLEHPNIVPVYELAHRPEDGQPFYTMRLIRGRSLRAAIAEHHRRRDQGNEDPVEATRLLGAFVSVCQALAYAHSRGVVHRDLKPENVVLGDFGEVIVLDWGLAKVLHGGVAEAAPEPVTVGEDALASATAFGRILGTPAYMAPEQAASRLDLLDARTDVYGLGAILFELLTGRPPHHGRDLAELLHNITHGETPRPRSVELTVPAALDNVCARAMAREPQQRYATALQLAEDVQRFLADEPVDLYFQRGLDLCEQGNVGHGLLWLARSLRDAAGAGGAGGAGAGGAGAALQRAVRTNLAAWSRLLRFPRTMVPHAGWVMAVAFSPDGKTLLTGSADRTARLWDVATGQPIGLPLLLSRGVASVAFSPDGQTVLTASACGAQRWEVTTGQPVGPPLHYQEQGHLWAAAFSPDGRTILTASADTTARLWDVATGQSVAPPLQHEGPVKAATFSPDGRMVLTGSWDNTARLWDATSGTPLAAPFRHPDQVWVVAFSPDSRTALTGCADRKARLWDVESGQPIGAPLPHQRMVSAVCFSPDGRTIFTGSDDKMVRSWEAATGHPIGPPLRHPSMVTAVACSGDGRLLATGSFDRKARLWDLTTERPSRPLQEHEGVIASMAFDREGQKVVTGSKQSVARVWEAATGRPLGPPLRIPDWGPVYAVAFSPDGRMLITGGIDCKARLWDAATGEACGSPFPHGTFVMTVGFSPDGRTVLAGSLDGSARLWDVTTGASPGPPLQHRGPVWAAAFSPDGSTILTGSWDTTAQLWDASTGERRGPPLQHQGQLWAVAFSPDGKTILTGSDDNTAQLWETATARPLGPPLQHHGVVRAAAFSPDGRIALTGCMDGTARLWDVASGKPLGPPLRHQGDVLAVAFTPDGKTILTGSQDRTIREWEPPPPPLEGHKERLVLWAQVLTGTELDDDGVVRLLDEPTLAERRRLLDECGGTPS
jgi:WD40 repeat protein/tRNA A-37 threonylcarbamoyl transferase component Bud32